MFGARCRQDLRQLPLELGILGTTMMPERIRLRGPFKAQHLFDAAIAVRRNDQVLTRKPRSSVRHAHEDIVMKLTLLMVPEQIVAPQGSFQRAPS